MEPDEQTTIPIYPVTGNYFLTELLINVSFISVISFIDYKVRAVCLEQPADTCKTAMLQMSGSTVIKAQLQHYI